MLRERRMTVGVGRTIPEDAGRPPRATTRAGTWCRASASTGRASRPRGRAAFRLACMRSWAARSARLHATRRSIHSVRLPRSPSREWTPGVDDVHNLLKRYMVEMGVDPGLTDAAAKVSADGVRYLSRDEIARFGLETRGIYETPWMPYENPFLTSSSSSSVTQASEAGGKDYRTTNVRIWCTGGGRALVRVSARAVIGRDGTPPVVRLAAGDSSYTLRAGETKGESGWEKGRTTGEIIAAFEIESGRAKAGSEQQFAAVSWEFLRNAIAAPGIVITEAPAPQASTASSRVVTLSTGGLPKALEPLQKNCGEPKSQDAPAVKFLDAPGVTGKPMI